MRTTKLTALILAPTFDHAAVRAEAARRRALADAAVERATIVEREAALAAAAAWTAYTDAVRAGSAEQSALLRASIAAERAQRAAHGRATAAWTRRNNLPIL